MRFGQKRAWNYSLISLVTIWLHIHIHHSFHKACFLCPGQYFNYLCLYSICLFSLSKLINWKLLLQILFSAFWTPCPDSMFQGCRLQSDKHQPITRPTRVFFGSATKTINFLTQFLSYDERKNFRCHFRWLKKKKKKKKKMKKKKKYDRKWKLKKARRSVK